MKIMFTYSYPPAASSNLNPKDGPNSLHLPIQENQCSKEPPNPAITPSHDIHITTPKKKTPNGAKPFIHGLRNRFTAPHVILESAIVLMRNQIRFKISFIYMQGVNFIFKNLLQNLIVFFFSLSLCHASVNPRLLLY